MTSPEPALAWKLAESSDPQRQQQQQQQEEETQQPQRRDEEQTRPSASPSLEDSDSDPGKYLLFHRSDDDDDGDGATSGGAGAAGTGGSAAPENHHVIPKSPDQRRPFRASVSLRGTSRRNVVPPVFLPYRVGGPPIASTTKAPLARTAESEREREPFGETDVADLDLSAAVGVSTSYSYDDPGADGVAEAANHSHNNHSSHNNVITPASARTRTRANSASTPIPPKYMYPPSSPIEAAARDLDDSPEATPSPVPPARSSPSSASKSATSSPGGAESDSWREWIPPPNRQLQKPRGGRSVSDAASRDVLLEPRHRDVDDGAAKNAVDTAAAVTANGMEAARLRPQFVRTKPSKDPQPPRSQQVVPPSLVVDSSRSNDSADGPKATTRDDGAATAACDRNESRPGRIQVVGGGTQTNPPPWASPYYVSHSRSAESNASEEWDPPRNPATNPIPPPPPPPRYNRHSTSSTPLPFATPDRVAPVPPSGYPPVDPARYDARYSDRGGAVPNYPPLPQAHSPYGYPPLDAANPSSSHPPPYGSGDVHGPPPGYVPANVHPPPPPSYAPERYPPDRAPPIPSAPTTPSSHPYPHHPPPHGHPYYAYPTPYAHPPSTLYGGTPHRPSSSYVTPPNEPQRGTPGDVDNDNVTNIHPLLKDYNPHFDGIALRPQFQNTGRKKGKNKDSSSEGGENAAVETPANEAGNGPTNATTRKRRRRRKPTEKAAAAAAMAAAAAAAAAEAKERKARLARLRAEKGRSADASGAARESADGVVDDADRSAPPDPDNDKPKQRDHEKAEEEEELQNLDPGSDEDIPASKRAAMASAAALRAAASGSPLRPPKAASEVDFDIADPPLEPIHPPSETAVLESAMDMTENDVLCGRGGGTNSQMGNRRFRALVRDFQPTYLMAKRREKPLMARSIVLIVRKRGGRFLRRDEENGQLFEVGDEKAEAKTSQALREGLDVRATKTAANTLMGTDGSKRRKRLPVPNDDGGEPNIAMPLGNMEPVQVDTAGARSVSKQDEVATPGRDPPFLHPAPQSDGRARPLPPHRYVSDPYGRPDYGPPPPHPGGYGHHPSCSYYPPPPPPPHPGSDPYYPGYDYGPPTPVRSHHVPYPPPPSYSHPPHPSSSTPGMHPSYSYTSPAMSYDSQFSPPRNEGRKRQNPNPLTPVHSRVNHL